MTASLHELELEAQVNVRGAAQPGFPGAPNTTADVDGKLVLWLGPDEWLVLGGREEDYRGALAATDVSANRVALELTGDVESVLAQGCSLDLERMGRDTCAQTLLARVEVVLHRASEDAFTILVRPSFAPYVRAWLEDAIRGLEAPS